MQRGEKDANTLLVCGCTRRRNHSAGSGVKVCMYSRAPALLGSQSTTAVPMLARMSTRGGERRNPCRTSCLVCFRKFLGFKRLIYTRTQRPHNAHMQKTTVQYNHNRCQTRSQQMGPYCSTHTRARKEGTNEGGRSTTAAGQLMNPTQPRAAIATQVTPLSRARKPSLFS